MASARSTLTALFEPLQIGDMLLPNRVAMSPMTRARSDTATRQANQKMKEYYCQRATAGLIITEGVAPSAEGYGWVNTAGIYTPEHSESWKQVTEGVHSQQGRIFCQLWHCGRQSHSSLQEGGVLPVSASAIGKTGEAHTPNGKLPYEVPRALEESEIPRVVSDFVNAAEMAKQAGFDGIELHSANGYLLDCFLQSSTNQRTDRYGGSVENRFRLLDEVIDAVCKVFPANRVGVKLSPNGAYGDMGYPEIREDFLYYFSRLEGRGLAYVTCVNGLQFGFHDKAEALTLEDVRKVYTGVLMANCGYDGESAEADVSAGKCDMVAFGRPFITNPDLVRRLKEGLPLADMEADMKKWLYSSSSEGYTDFPFYQPA